MKNQLIKIKNDRTTVVYVVTIISALLIISASSQILTKRLESTTGVIGGIYIDDVVLTSGLDASGYPINQMSRFEAGIRQIYCFIDVKGVFRFPMTGYILVRWYYEGEQIRAHYFQTDSEPAILSIETTDSEPLRPGRYSLEVYIRQTLIETVEFQVS